MGDYIHTTIVRPTRAAAKEWKKVLITIGIDVVTVIAIVLLFSLYSEFLMPIASSLQGHDLENRMVLIKQVGDYTQDLELLLGGLIFGGIALFLAIVFALSYSRKWVYQYITGEKRKLWSNFGIDVLFGFFYFVFILLIGSTFKENIMGIGAILFTIITFFKRFLFYLTGETHIFTLDKKKFLSQFLLLFPSLIICCIVLYLLNLHLYLLLLAFPLLSFYRFYSYFLLKGTGSL